MGFVALVTLATPATGDEALFACLDKLTDTDAPNACIDTFIERCLDPEFYHSDPTYETTCYQGAIDHVHHVLADVRKDAEQGLKSRIKAAALRQGMRIVDARCDYHQEIAEIRGKMDAAEKASYLAPCVSLGYAAIYHKVIVRENTQ